MLILIDNYDSFTYNIFQYLREVSSLEVGVFRNDAISIEELEELSPRGIILSPGPGRPEEAGISVEIIQHFAGRVPILGICLGHQAIGYAFGGIVEGARRIVHGKAEEIRLDGRGLFRSIPSPAVFTRYHSLVLQRDSLPEDLEVTAFSMDGEIMGVRHKKWCIEGIQFHPESIASEFGRKILCNFLDYKREPFKSREVLTRIIEGQDMTVEEAEGFMDTVTSGDFPSAGIAGFLTALHAKGITPEEITGCVKILREKKLPFTYDKPVLDTCGTGGDGLGTFNISSMAALVASACGALVAKHGNRAVSSTSGSADFYKALGVPVELSPEHSQSFLEKTGFTFLYAPIYHSAMRYASEARRDLGIKTIFNLLGPLANPAEAEYQVIGVYDAEFCLTMAKAAHMLGIKRVMVVHGMDGQDEISVTGPSRIVSVWEDGVVKDRIFDPAELGLCVYPPEELQGGTAEENAETAVRLITGRGSAAILDAVALNAGAGLLTCGIVTSMREGYAAARNAILSGKVKEKLDEIRREYRLYENT